MRKFQPRIWRAINDVSSETCHTQGYFNPEDVCPGKPLAHVFQLLRVQRGPKMNRKSIKSIQLCQIDQYGAIDKGVYFGKWKSQMKNSK